MNKLLLLVAVSACGSSGSGVDSGKKLNALTNSEAMEECQYFHDSYAQRTVSCPNDTGGTTTLTIGGGDVAMCTTSLEAEIPAVPNCTATVGDAEDCLDFEYGLTDAQLCTGTGVTPPASCIRLNSADCQTPDQTARTQPGGLPVITPALLSRLRR